MSTADPNVLLIGVGNEYRSDDGAGLYAARAIREKHLPDLVVKEESGEGAALMDAWDGFARVVVVDAVSSGAVPGTIHRLDAGVQSVPSKFFHYSTHAFSVAEAVELARTIGRLPESLVLFGIEGETYIAGSHLSRPVADALPGLIDRIVFELVPSSEKKNG